MLVKYLRGDREFDSGTVAGAYRAVCQHLRDRGQSWARYERIVTGGMVVRASDARSRPGLQALPQIGKFSAQSQSDRCDL
jgi:hypothetical protein